MPLVLDPSSSTTAREHTTFCNQTRFAQRASCPLLCYSHQMSRITILRTILQPDDAPRLAIDRIEATESVPMNRADTEVRDFHVVKRQCLDHDTTSDHA